MDEWVEGAGTACYECGERHSEDDLVWQYEQILGAFSNFCPPTSNFRSSHRHYDIDWDASEYCVADYTLGRRPRGAPCATCGKKYRKDSLTAMPITWFDQPGLALLCEDCLAESEETEEITENRMTARRYPARWK